MNKNRRLPTGNYTANTDYYLRAWKKEAQPVIKKTGWKLIAFDPDFQFADKDHKNVVSLPLWAVRDLAKK